MSEPTNPIIVGVCLAVHAGAPHAGIAPPETRAGIAFANVFVAIENASLANAVVTVLGITIVGIASGKVLMSDMSQRVYHLTALQKIDGVYYLDNPEGFGDDKWVKAVLTYACQNRRFVIETQPMLVRGASASAA